LAEARFGHRPHALAPGIFTKMPALVSVYDRDGTVAVCCGGVDMGQGLHTKVAQTVARELGIPLSLISVKPNNSLVNPNGLVTGGSIGSETACLAAQLACRVLRERLQPYQEKVDGEKVADGEKVDGEKVADGEKKEDGEKVTDGEKKEDGEKVADGEKKEDGEKVADGEKDCARSVEQWRRLVRAASAAGVNLTSHSLQPPPPGHYNIWGVTAAETELDVLTGESRVNRVDLYEDAGLPLSPAIDIGQVEGAFAFGMGLHLTERLRYDPATAKLLTNRAWNYYIPSHKDMPRDFRVTLLKNNKNPVGIFNSKATGEPAILMSAACMLALRRAVSAARRDAGVADWCPLDSPVTVEKAGLACGTGEETMLLT